MAKWEPKTNSIAKSQSHNDNKYFSFCYWLKFNRFKYTYTGSHELFGWALRLTSVYGNTAKKSQ